MLVGEEHGGGTISDSGLADASLVAYEFGRHAAPGPLAVVNVVAATLSEQNAAPDVLAGLLSGEGIAKLVRAAVRFDSVGADRRGHRVGRRPRAQRRGPHRRVGRAGGSPPGDLQ